MDKFCSQCGNSLNGRFCSNCGKENSSIHNLEGQSIPASPPQATGLAIASLIMSFFIAPAGLIMGIVARNEIAKSRGEKGGEGLALAAIIISGVVIFIFIVVIIALAYASSTYY